MKKNYNLQCILLVCIFALNMQVVFAQSSSWQNSIGMKFVEVSGGSFQMGTPSGGTDPERPVHRVTLTGFWMSSTEVTQAQWQAVMGSNPSDPSLGSGPNYPVNMVSWYDILAFCNKLSLKEGLTPAYTIKGSTDPAKWGQVPTNYDPDWDKPTLNLEANGYRMPTESEWEFAARGGTASKGYKFIGGDMANELGWHSENSSNKLQPVAQKKPNELGLYDMNGNVAEWVWDRWNKYSAEAKNDPMGLQSGWQRPIRGSSIHSWQGDFRPSNRGNAVNPHDKGNAYGFRIVRRGVKDTKASTQPEQEKPTQSSEPEIKVGASIKNSIGQVLMGVPGGSFQMGTPSGGTDPERPVHRVTLTGFWMSSTEVTQAQWQAVMGSNPSDPSLGSGPNYPVNMVSWYDILAFCNKLSLKEGLTPAYTIKGSTDPAKWGQVPTNYDPDWDKPTLNLEANGYRMPTESEWEFAARGGTASKGYKFIGGDMANELGWHSENSSNKLQPVAQKKPNELGLYDMNGNVAEWVWDRWNKYSAEAKNDPMGLQSGWQRPIRGSSIHSWQGDFRPSNRGNAVNPHDKGNAYGFRIVRRGSQANEIADDQGEVKGQRPQPSGRPTHPQRPAASTTPQRPTANSGTPKKEFTFSTPSSTENVNEDAKELYGYWRYKSGNPLEVRGRDAGPDPWYHLRDKGELDLFKPWENLRESVGSWKKEGNVVTIKLRTSDEVKYIMVNKDLLELSVTMDDPRNPGKKLYFKNTYTRVNMDGK